MKKDIRDRLRSNILLADGAMGSLVVARGAPADGERSAEIGPAVLEAGRQ